MKKLVTSFALLALMALSACNSGGGDGGGGGSTGGDYAATPQPCNGTTTACDTSTNPNQYCGQQYVNGTWQYRTCSYGGWQFPQNYNPYNGSCGCGSGYMPVYGSFGYACAPSQNYSSYRVWYVSYSFGGYNGRQYWRSAGQNSMWLNNWQGTYQSTYNNNSCQNQIAQGCDVRLNNCPGGSVCRPAGGGSTIGLCTR